MSHPDPCTLIAFDSDFFQRRVARVAASRLDPELVDAVRAFCARKGVDWLTFLAESGHAETVRLAQDAGFRLVDVRVTLDADLSGLSGTPHPALRPFLSADLDALESIARRSHSDSRYYYDGHLDRARCDEFYATWIRNSCSGWAQAVLVAGEPGSPQGYISCHLDDDGAQGHIGLIAVAEQAQGSGLGRQLIEGALLWLRDQGRRRAWVVTQGRNTRAQRAYQRCGLTTRDLSLWFHWWPKEGQLT